MRFEDHQRLIWDFNGSFVYESRRHLSQILRFCLLTTITNFLQSSGMCLVERLRCGVQSRECVDDGVSLITWIFCSHFCFTFGMIDYRAGFLWWVYCEKFLVVLTDFRLEVHLLVWNASVTFLGLNRYSMRAIFCSLMLHSNIFSNECYRIIDIFWRYR